MKIAKCSNQDCDFTEEFEPDEFGLTYFQAIGDCPFCGWKTIYEDGKLTEELIEFKLVDDV